MHLILLQPGLVVMDEEVYGVERRVLYSTSPGVGPIMSCWMEDQRVSWLGQLDLNQYLPLPCLLVSATRLSS